MKLGVSNVFLGIDLGTSAVKTVLVDGNQKVLGFASAGLKPATPRPGWSEDDPQNWWDAVEATIGTLRREHRVKLSHVQAIGLSGQMHACLLLDAQDRPVRPAILWNDGRARKQASELSNLHPELGSVLGMHPAAGFAAAQISWLREHEPIVLERARYMLLPKDEIRLRLTGVKATDPSDAAGTCLLDERSGQWSQEAAGNCGVDPDWLPPLIESNAVAGFLRAEIAEKFGMRVGIPVACGGGDTPVGGIGIGAIGRGDGFISLGTSAQVFLADDRFTPAPDRQVHAFCHAAPGRWYEMAALLNGASALAAAVAWIGGRDVDEILRRVETSYAGPSNLLALPYLSGERTPHNDPNARGVLFGLTARSTSEDIVQATLEAVAFSLADGLEAIRTARVIPDELALIGGGARSSFWSGMIANILGIRLVRFRDSYRGPAFGAARLARLALTGESVEAVSVKPPVEQVFEPDPAMTDRYAPRIAAFRDLYRALAHQFHPATP